MTTHATHEATGAAFEPVLMQRARERSWAVLHAIRARMLPGISEDEARSAAADIIDAMGAERLWHPTYIRIGANTLKTYRQASEPGVRLGGNDIYFIDLGLVFDGHEGDVGDTFTVGHAPERAACAEAAHELFQCVGNAWRERGLSGRRLYEFAADQARRMGWRLNHAIKGHRLGDFPHAVHKAGNLGDLESRPSAGLWMLEIQIAHPELPFGAFHEDLLGDPGSR